MHMNLHRFFSQVAVLIGAVLFSIGLQALAFTQPSASPPNADAYAPLNAGPSVQKKSGGLFLNTGGASNGLIVQFGNVGIGTLTPVAKLSVAGGVQIGDDTSACTEANYGTLRSNNNSLQYCGSITSTTQSGGACNTGCPGGTALYPISSWGTCITYMCQRTTQTYRWGTVTMNP